ncbi:inositol monophosphatase [Eremomyces bilateralis CBS 781.70]|uniref:Inositol-1-monophosphatase n=1 Tax=Eremomyces bilateralis CBS 781.70 TaxID=1392243 RepID=A0A6G1GFB2_9PEZI|nr:inositol monophosphatase [Eremomyces bilateralis CBS 781.70]KAF1816758.1 inositol monophosphatase [Eremomyces bilateralis CBS 781.70]
MYSISDEELDHVYRFALDLANGAGEMLQKSVRGRMQSNSLTNLQQEEKESAVDLVTKADEDVEAFIKRSIQEKFPSHHFIGEETYSKGASRQYLIGDEPTWCVDPLDGTVNFIHLFPMYCVSIGFVVNGKPVVGVINAPFLKQTFSACKGRGAWLNEKQKLPLIRNPIPPIPPNAPSGCIFSCEWGKDRRDHPDSNMHRKIEVFLNMAAEIGGRGGKGGMAHGIRSLGSATMDIAYTAMGAFDIWWEGGCWEWDVCAGICILEEAGGLITTSNPPNDFETAPIEPVKLGSRLYLGIRPAGPSSIETSREGQERAIRETWRRVRGLDYLRPGV